MWRIFQAAGGLDELVLNQHTLRAADGAELRYTATCGDVLLAIAAWGDRWTTDSAGPPVLIRHRTCGNVTSAELRCAECHQPLHAQDVDVEPHTSV